MARAFLVPVTLPAGSTSPTPAINTASTALATTEYTDRAVMAPITAITGTSQTVGITHLGAWLDCENAATQTLTIDTDANASWPANAQIQGAQMGAGKVSFVGGSGVTIRVRAAFVASSAGQYAVWGLKRVGANEWIRFGDLEAA